MELHFENPVRPFQVFARLLSGDTKTLLFDTPSVRALAIKQRIFEFTKLPISQQRLICAGRQLDDSTLIPSSGSTVHLCLRLRGGKGGFGSLLRGAATKAGQKKTNNFDACRDMSGRRLRHVNAEKKLEEWRAAEEERRLEKIAEDFIKKKAKKGRKGVGDGEAHKYVQKYREESAKCAAQVELSVREAMSSSAASSRSAKRKAGADSGRDGKKLKIWMGKRKLAESDGNDTDEDSSDNDEENEKSVVLDNANSSDSVKDGEETSDSLTGGRSEGAYNAGSPENGSPSGGQKENIVLESMASGVCPPERSLSNKETRIVESVGHEENEDQVSLFPCSEEAPRSGDAHQSEKEEFEKFKHGNNEAAASKKAGDSLSYGEGSERAVDADNDINGVSETDGVVMDETVSLKAEKGEERPLNFDDYNSAAALEVLGLERLKTELQKRGLKCGGTLQERASRLFLLKTSPLDKIPKKLHAKK